MNNIENPLVSVVLITYNSSKYVLETLESVKNQTWNNIELIVSDDGSTDQTLEICSNWLTNNTSRFSRTQLISVPENTGIPANCNRAYRIIKGEWLKTISGDDILLNTCISDNINFTRCFPEASFIVSDINEIDENGEILRHKVVNEGLLFFSSLSSAKKQLKAYIRWSAFLNTPTFFCNTKMIVKVGYCDEEFKIYEDTTMIIRVMECNYKMYYMNKTTVSYRIHKKAISRNRKENENRDKEILMVFNKYRRQHLNRLNLFDLSVYYENWLKYGYKKINGYIEISKLRKLSIFYWYMKLKGVKSY